MASADMTPHDSARRHGSFGSPQRAETAARSMWARLYDWRQHTTPDKPAQATWAAPCPGCKVDAHWWSGMTTRGLLYRMACPRCGKHEWTPTEASR